VIGRGRFSRDRHGRIRPGLEEPERALLRMLPEQARELVDHDDPSAQRLFPVAYTDDEAAQADYRQMMEGSLLEHHQHALDTLVATIDATTIDADELNAWLGAVEVLRLLLGTQLDVGEDFVEVEPDHPQVDQFTVYQYLSMLQNEIVESLTAALPRDGTSA
jgi:Domain of unknown function (DUF2017)